MLLKMHDSQQPRPPPTAGFRIIEPRPPRRAGAPPSGHFSNTRPCLPQECSAGPKPPARRQLPPARPGPCRVRWLRSAPVSQSRASRSCNRRLPGTAIPCGRTACWSRPTSDRFDKGRFFGGCVRRRRALRAARKRLEADGRCARGAKPPARQPAECLRASAARQPQRNVAHSSRQIVCFRSSYPCWPPADSSSAFEHTRMG